MSLKLHNHDVNITYKSTTASFYRNQSLPQRTLSETELGVRSAFTRGHDHGTLRRRTGFLEAVSSIGPVEADNI